MSVDRYARLNQMQKEKRGLVRVAAYCRVSTDHEDQLNSFESQKRYFEQYIRQNPRWILYDIFADEGLSGTTTRKRAAFCRMIQCAQHRDFDLIVTKEISRFARNTLDSIYYTRELKRYGVGVIFLNDGINTMDGDSELRLAILSSIAQEESRRTSQRVKWGQLRQMEHGVVFGRNMLGYDIRNGKMQINENGARIVQLIFHKYLKEGKGTGVIARELTEAGIHPMYAKRWSSSVILRILRNEKYCGDLVQKKTYTPDYLSHEKKYNHGQEPFVILTEHHPAIISRADYQQANRILDSRADGQAGKHKYSARAPFSGKIHRAVCGSSYVVRHRIRKDGTKIRSWRCQKANQQGKARIHPDGTVTGCNNGSVPQRAINRIMGQLVAQMLETRPEAIPELKAALGGDCPSECAAALDRLLRGETEDECFYASLVDEVLIGAQGQVSIRLKGAAEPVVFLRQSHSDQDLL